MAMFHSFLLVHQRVTYHIYSIRWTWKTWSRQALSPRPFGHWPCVVLKQRWGWFPTNTSNISKKKIQPTAPSIFDSLMPLSYGHVDSLKEMLWGNWIFINTQKKKKKTSINQGSYLKSRRLCFFVSGGWDEMLLGLSQPRSRDRPPGPTGWANSWGLLMDTRRRGYLQHREAWIEPIQC